MGAGEGARVDGMRNAEVQDHRAPPGAAVNHDHQALFDPPMRAGPAYCTTISTRRLRPRPASLALPVAGARGPTPCAARRSPATPKRSTSTASTLAARSAEIFWLCPKLPWLSLWPTTYSFSALRSESWRRCGRDLCVGRAVRRVSTAIAGQCPRADIRGWQVVMTRHGFAWRGRAKPPGLERRRGCVRLLAKHHTNARLSGWTPRSGTRLCPLDLMIDASNRRTQPHASL